MIVKPSSTEVFAKRESGGKGFNLFLMTRMGLPVPAWVVLGKSFFNSYLEQTSLTEKLSAELDSF